MQFRDAFLISAILLIYSLPWMNSSEIKDQLKIKCLDNTIMIQHEQATAFNGTIYVRNHYNKRECRANVTNSNKTIFNVSIADCTSAKKNGSVELDLIVLRHPVFLTKNATAFHVNCIHNEWLVSTIFNVPDIPTSKVLHSEFIPQRSSKIRVPLVTRGTLSKINAIISIFHNKLWKIVNAMRWIMNIKNHH